MTASLGRTILQVLLLLIASRATAQAVAPEFAHGVHYTFERMTAERTVQDASDHGRITLVAYVYRSMKPDPRRIVLYSHGSTGGWTVSPKEPVEPPHAIVRYFTSRGYTLVAPMRRGVSESSGNYIEECEFQAGKCSIADNTALFDSGLREATLDSQAVVDQIIYGKLAARNSPILLSGVSRGGFLSLILAAERPNTTAGVINFVGGWLSISDSWPAELNERRKRFQVDRLAQVGKTLRMPTLWIYGDRDPFYSEAVTRQFFGAFHGTGGSGEYFFVSDAALRNGHAVANFLSLWQAKADEYLAQVQTR